MGKKCKVRVRYSFWERRFGSRKHLLPVFSKKKKNKLKTYQKVPKKIMHVPDHGTHHRVKFRPEMDIVCVLCKNDKFPDLRFKFLDLISDRKFVIFAQGAYDVISGQNFTRWCVPWSDTCMIFFGIFWKVFQIFLCSRKYREHMSPGAKTLLSGR